MKKTIFIISLISIAFYSCDKVDDPTPDNFVGTEGIIWDDSLFIESSPTMRKIIIEEFTGQLCTFCPVGAREIERLDSIYTDQFIPISVHAGAFADPNNGAPNDFRTEAGTAYNNTFGASGYPAGTVSRINNAAVTGNSQWEVDIQSIENDVPKVSIGLSTLYDDSTRTLKTIVSTEWLSSEVGTYNLQLYLVEDSIVAYQLDNGNPIQNYVHRHMLRKAINSTWGTPIPSSNLGDIDTQDFAIEVDNEFDKNHCIVVAHIYKVSPDYEILQAEELHIVDTH
ncbi:MAG: Omp28 family outer membrane lipoprotein [Vicingaceae bacterium]|nr:Omp28 family outer membrane lipoprotein [Vicingaceae bacterium]